MTGGKAKNEDFTAHVKEDVPEEEFTRQAVQPGLGLSNDRLSGRRVCRSSTALKRSNRPPRWPTRTTWRVRHAALAVGAGRV